MDYILCVVYYSLVYYLFYLQASVPLNPLHLFQPLLPSCSPLVFTNLFSVCVSLFLGKFSHSYKNFHHQTDVWYESPDKTFFILYDHQVSFYSNIL